MTPIRQMLYVSTLTRPLPPQEERGLLATSQRNNRRRDLTGILACSGHYFLQVLEGRSEDVEAVLRKIRVDDRHTDIRTLVDRHVQTRNYPNWSMAYVYRLDLADDIERLIDPAMPPVDAGDVMNRLVPDSINGAL